MSVSTLVSTRYQILCTLAKTLVWISKQIFTCTIDALYWEIKSWLDFGFNRKKNYVGAVKKLKLYNFQTKEPQKKKKNIRK